MRSAYGAGRSVTVADADFVWSVKLVAVTVTVCCDVIADGAVYSPLSLMLPTPSGLIDQETVASPALTTLAANRCFCDGRRVIADGLTVIAAGG